MTLRERYELTRTINPAHCFPTLDDAVSAYIQPTGAAWRGCGDEILIGTAPPAEYSRWGREASDVLAAAATTGGR